MSPSNLMKMTAYSGGKSRILQRNRKNKLHFIKTREFRRRNSLVLYVYREIPAEKRELLSRIVRLLAEIQDLLVGFKHLLSGRLKTCQAGSSKDKTPVELAVPVAVDHRAYRGKAQGIEASAAARPVPAVIVRLAVLVAVDHQAYRGKVQEAEASAAVRPAPAVIVRLAVLVAVDHRAYRGKAQGIEASAAARPVPAVIVRLAVLVAVDHRAYRGKAQEAEASAAARPVPAVIVRLAVPVAVDHRAYRGRAQGAEASAAARPVPAGKSHENRVPAGLRPGRGVEETFVGSNAAHNIHSSKNLLICIHNILFFLATLGH
ncbi:hypothetical protein QUF84_08030 [Fictibacillus enclensis]|uniref:hypothetical protein n=1 Tax=Fictibacillus enclensis TaxID=1017270 RepID=UPI0025A04365|nr:hypothetical protein [Fictibacillus enclensis]MDM5337162.1 hypothetical protein [Fictibacillus enclensis]